MLASKRWFLCAIYIMVMHSIYISTTRYFQNQLFQSGDPTKYGILKMDDRICPCANRGGSLRHINTTINGSIYGIKPADIMAMPHLKFLTGLKNPCFIVHDSPKDDGGAWVTKDNVLKCWPYFQLIGVEKCGTTDLYNKLHLHHHLLKMVNPHTGTSVKEPLWYNGFMHKELHNDTLGGYLRLMDNATWDIYNSCKDKIINKSDYQRPGSECPKIVGDFSARTINQNFLWYQDKANLHYYFPKYLTADKVHHVYPQTKLIVMLRDPTERMFSDYRYYKGKLLSRNLSSEDFHKHVLAAIDTWNDCTINMRVDPEKCAQGFNWTLSNNTTLDNFWGFNSSERIALGIYSIFLKRWLQLFPRSSIHVIKLEEYSTSSLDYIETHILPLLGLEPYRPKIKQFMVQVDGVRSNRNRKIHLTMWNKTRRLLDRFYAPYNFQLSEMLHNKKFLWK